MALTEFNVSDVNLKAKNYESVTVGLVDTYCTFLISAPQKWISICEMGF